MSKSAGRRQQQLECMYLLSRDDLDRMQRVVTEDDEARERDLPPATPGELPPAVEPMDVDEQQFPQERSAALPRVSFAERGVSQVPPAPLPPPTADFGLAARHALGPPLRSYAQSDAVPVRVINTGRPSTDANVARVPRNANSSSSSRRRKKGELTTRQLMKKTVDNRLATLRGQAPPHPEVLQEEQQQQPEHQHVLQPPVPPPPPHMTLAAQHSRGPPLASASAPVVVPAAAAPRGRSAQVSSSRRQKGPPLRRQPAPVPLPPAPRRPPIAGDDALPSSYSRGPPVSAAAATALPPPPPPGDVLPPPVRVARARKRASLRAVSAPTKRIVVPPPPPPSIPAVAATEANNYPMWGETPSLPPPPPEPAVLSPPPVYEPQPQSAPPLQIPPLPPPAPAQKRGLDDEADGADDDGAFAAWSRSRKLPRHQQQEGLVQQQVEPIDVDVFHGEASTKRARQGDDGSDFKRFRPTPPQGVKRPRPPEEVPEEVVIDPKRNKYEMW